MTKLVLFTAACFVLLLLNGAHHVVEGRPHRERRNDYMLFVLGDSYADVGNRPQTSEKTVLSRAWFYPYGISGSAHGNRPTGRVSDGMVQSDILAKILGGDESPPPSRRHWRDSDKVDPSGVNFAVGGAGVLSDDRAAPSLGQQVDQLASLISSGAVETADLDRSVALVAISTGADYNGRITHESSSRDMTALTGQVTDELVAAVRRLRDLGVTKVLVNLLPALGCMPWQSVASNYATCDSHSNALASMHNAALRRRLHDSYDDVLLLDLYSIFSNSVQPNVGPCCRNPDPNGYCGQDDSSGRPHYSVCDNPDQAFFWDYMHPTQAGWETIMQQLQGPIQDFLGIQSSW
ncbi:hypothetical protein HU200_030613 [Digitaria exilis]|uniref:GDSL esterase/lipase n=1 Tax=Digitaria exilis TaxID=1010633 RepID=A0A835BR15_9POAL|nr:hypothetical protein HU200_030613 [Digitaria exilis]CAB3459145.1 unnamed protein product [Digitaria exilis]